MLGESSVQANALHSPPRRRVKRERCEKTTTLNPVYFFVLLLIKFVARREVRWYYSR